MEVGYLGGLFFEADELSEPLEAEVPEDISNKDPKNSGEIRRNKRRKVHGGPNQGNAAEEKWRKIGRAHV